MNSAYDDDNETYVPDDADLWLAQFDSDDEGAPVKVDPGKTADATGGVWNGKDFEAEKESDESPIFDSEIFAAEIEVAESFDGQSESKQRRGPRMDNRSRAIRNEMLRAFNIPFVNTGWMADAACNPGNGFPVGAWWQDHDPNTFFPEPGRLELIDRAKWTCFVCPVKALCENYAETTSQQYGVWAGKIVKHSRATDERLAELKAERAMVHEGRKPKLTSEESVQRDVEKRGHRARLRNARRRNPDKPKLKPGPKLKIDFGSAPVLPIVAPRLGLNVRANLDLEKS